MKFRAAVIFFLLLFITTPVFAAPKVMDILKRMDFLYEQVTDLSLKMTMSEKKAGRGIKIYQFLYFRKDKTNQFLMITIAPESDKGIGYLCVGKNAWIYNRDSRTFRHLNREESIPRPDLRGDDSEGRKYVELYKPLTDASGKEDISEELLERKQAYRFSVIAKVKNITYPKQVFWLEKETYRILKIQSYSHSNTLMRTEYFTRWTKIEDKYLALQVIFVDEFNKGNITIADFYRISISPINPKIFTKPYLENLNK